MSGSKDICQVVTASGTFLWDYCLGIFIDTSYMLSTGSGYQGTKSRGKSYLSAGEKICQNHSSILTQERRDRNDRNSFFPLSLILPPMDDTGTPGLHPYCPQPSPRTSTSPGSGLLAAHPLETSGYLFQQREVGNPHAPSYDTHRGRMLSEQSEKAWWSIRVIIQKNSNVEKGHCVL